MKVNIKNVSALLIALSIFFASPSFSDQLITDIVKLSQTDVSTTASGNLLSKNIKVTFQNISDAPVRDVKLKLSYVSGSSEELAYEQYIGDVFSGDAISLGDTVDVVIDRSQLTDGIFIYTWLVELNTYDGSQILDEILIEKIE
jgi:hypothetical protein